MGTLSEQLVLRNLPLPARVVLSAFLVSVGLGYFSALVQLHFVHAAPGQLLPGAAESKKAYGPGERAQSHFERLLEAPEGEKFNGTGTMRPAFTTKSEGWKKLIKKLDELQHQALLAEREGERLALLEWVRAGAKKAEYEQDDFRLPDNLAAQPITDELLVNDGDQPAQPRRARVKTIVDKRCVECHNPDLEKTADANAAKYPLETYEHLKPYVESKAQAGMSLNKLAQTTHVHLLGFSMLYGLTGLIFAFTSYPGWAKLVLGPLPLLAQVVDITFWWLGRVDARFAGAIAITGGVVALGLFLQIVLSLFNMYDRHGKKVVVILLLLAAVSGYIAKTQVIDPYLEQERLSAASPE